MIGINGVPLPNSHYYNKIKENSIHASTCFFGLHQHNNSAVNSALLDLVFSNISDLGVSISSFPVVTPDKYHPPLLDFKLTFDCHRTSLAPHRSYAHGDTCCSTMFYVILTGLMF
jgi:hypothetical protein